MGGRRRGQNPNGNVNPESERNFIELPAANGEIFSHVGCSMKFLSNSRFTFPFGFCLQRKRLVDNQWGLPGATGRPMSLRWLPMGGRRLTRNPNGKDNPECESVCFRCGVFNETSFEFKIRVPARVLPTTEATRWQPTGPPGGHHPPDVAQLVANGRPPPWAKPKRERES